MSKIPAKFFKYRSVSNMGFIQQIFEKSEIYFSKPSSFNDVFDCAPVISVKGTDEDFKRFFDELFQKRMPEMNREERRKKIADSLPRWRAGDLDSIMKRGISEFMEEIGVCSLSEVPDDILMWSHYAKCNSGICLEFAATASIFAQAQKVEYQIERPEIKILTDSNEIWAEKAMLHKSSHWNYEKEWRIIDHNRPGHGPHSFDPNALTGVIFGSRTEISVQEKIKSWVGARNINLMRAVPDNNKFQLNLSPIL